MKDDDEITSSHGMRSSVGRIKKMVSTLAAVLLAAVELVTDDIRVHG